MIQLITTTDLLQDVTIVKYYDSVFSSMIIGNNYFSELKASFTDLFGGHSYTYENKVLDLYDEVFREIREKAEMSGANAIVGLRINITELSGKGMSMILIQATGTPVYFIERKTQEIIVDSKQNAVSYQQLKYAVQLNDFKKMNKLPDTDQWQFIFNSPTEDIYSKLFETYRTLQISIEKGLSLNEAQTTFIDNFEKLTEKMDIEKTKPIVYQLFSKIIVPLIKKCRLFDANKALEIFRKGDWDGGFELLKCDKTYYNYEDLNTMNEIVKYIDDTDRYINEDQDNTLKEFRKKTMILMELFVNE